jgi:hypothetical protein
MQSIREASVIRRSSATILLSTLAWSVSFAMPAHAVGEPSIARAVTNDDGDGHLDGVTLAFSEAMEASAPTASWFAASPEEAGFHVDGYAIIGGVWGTGASANTLKLNLTPLAVWDTGATPTVRYRPVAGGPKAAVTGLGLGATSASGLTSNDGAGPVLASAQARDLSPVNLFNAVGDELTIGFSEPVTLAGVGPTRSANLENVIKFTSVPADGSNGCPVDGTALQNQNFPQQATGVAPITPGDGAAASATITASMRAENVASIQRFVGVPKGCALAIDATNNAVIKDAANNDARPFNAAPGKTIVARVTPASVSLLSAETTDGVASTPDGVPDGLALTFSAPLNDATIDLFTDLVTVRALGAELTLGDADTGATTGDALARIGVSIPADVAADDVTITYVAGPCSHSTSATTSSGPTGAVPYGNGYAACISTFDVGATDGVGPAILQAVTIDADLDGRIDGVNATFSEALDVSAPAGWSLGGLQATGFTIIDPTHATIVFPEGPIADGGNLPALGYTHQADEPTLDAAENEVPTATWPTSDGVGPAVRTAVAQDLDGDSHIDRISATLSEAVQATASPVVRFANITATDVDLSGDQLVATFTGETGSGGVADLIVVSGIADLGGTPMPSVAFDQISESIAPTGTIAVSPSAPIPAGDATVRAVYTEAMRDEALAVTIGTTTISPVADAEHTANGWRIDDPAVWEGAITIAADACDVPTGCSVTLSADGGHDVAGLAQAAPLQLQTAIDTIAPAAAPITAVDGLGTDSDPQNVINGRATNLAVMVDVPDGQAEGGLVEVLIDGGSMNELLVGEIAAGASTVRLESHYGTIEEFQAALGGDGSHDLRTSLCDSASNCVEGPSLAIVVDTVGAEVLVEQPEDDVLIAGGSTFGIQWQTAPTDEPITVALAYSLDGTRWTTIAAGQDANGSFAWRTPKIDVNNVRVRATSSDEAGNTASAMPAGKLAIDTIAPTIRSFSVPNRVLKGGSRVPVRWSAQDSSLVFVTAPIKLEESLDAGRHWRPINAGRYGKVNDGAEVLKVPARTSSTYRVRLTVTDGLGRRTMTATRSMVIKRAR